MQKNGVWTEASLKDLGRRGGCFEEITF